MMMMIMVILVVVVVVYEFDVVVQYNRQYPLYRNRLEMPIGRDRSNKIH